MLNSQCFVVRGSYYYYHYLQTNFDDDGWGCAYRSLQVCHFLSRFSQVSTIESWFLLNGFVSCPVQTHREIQKSIYVEGLRQFEFIGSSEWIGSTGPRLFSLISLLEIQAVLSSYMKVNSKILHLASGSLILDYTLQLQSHFETHGIHARYFFLIVHQ